MWFASFILEMTFFFMCLALGIGFIIVGVKASISLMNGVSKWIDKKLSGFGKSANFDIYEWYYRRKQSN